MARQHCRCKSVNAPNLATVKDFLCFYIARNRGKIDENEGPTADSVNSFAKLFFAGFIRITGTLTDEADKSERYNVSFPKDEADQTSQLLVGPKNAHCREV
jgi:hypothetical protein